MLEHLRGASHHITRLEAAAKQPNIVFHCPVIVCNCSVHVVISSTLLASSNMFLFHITPSQCFPAPGVCIHIPPLKLVSSQPNLLPKITLIMTHTNIPTHITKHYCCIVTMISEVSCAIYEYISSSTPHITPSAFHQALLANDTVPTVSYFTNKHILRVVLNSLWHEPQTLFA